MPDIPVPILTLIGPVSARAVSIRGSRVSIRGSRYSCANRCCSEAKADCCPGAYAAMVTMMAVMAMPSVMATSVPIMLSGGGKRGCYDMTSAVESASAVIFRTLTMIFLTLKFQRRHDRMSATCPDGR